MKSTSAAIGGHLFAQAWVASPPEVHSAALNSGPGLAALLAAAGAWATLAAEYAAATEELTATLSGVPATSWAGPAAQCYANAHAPYLAWLARAGATATHAAAQHHAVATAHTAALAGMPTLAELALNHTVHATLVATNFFGVNTVPIALNEADYVRMWMQAATVMAGYAATSAVAIESMPHPEPAPPVYNADGGSGGREPSEPADPTDPVDPVDEANRWFWFIFWNIVGWSTFLFIVTIPVRIPIVLPLLIFGINQLITMLTPPVEELPGEEPAPTPAPVATRPPADEPVPVAVGIPISGPAAPAGSSTGTAGSVNPAPPPSSPTGVEMLGYLVGGGHAEGFGPTLIDRDRGSAPGAGLASAAAARSASATRGHTGIRRRRRVIRRDFGDATMTLDATAAPEPEPAVTGSARGAGPLGFTGTATRTDVRSAGLTTLGSNAFDEATQVPLLPETWERN